MFVWNKFSNCQDDQQRKTEEGKIERLVKITKEFWYGILFGTFFDNIQTYEIKFLTKISSFAVLKSHNFSMFSVVNGLHRN